MKTVAKVIFLIFATIVSQIRTLSAASVRGSHADTNLSAIVTPAFVSQYMFRGVKLGGAALQTALEVSRNNVVIGAWSSISTDRSSSIAGDSEIDLFGSYVLSLTNSVSVEAGATLYAYPNVATSGALHKHTFEPNAGLSYTIGSLRINPRLYYDVSVKSTIYETNFAYTIPLQGLLKSLNLTGVLGSFLTRDAEKNVKEMTRNWGDYWLCSASVPISITTNSDLTLGLLYTRGSSNYIKRGQTPKIANPNATGRGVISISYAWSF